MKNSTFILFLVLALTACEKHKINKTENKLEGSWTLVKSEYGNTENDLTGREQIMTFYDNAIDYEVYDGYHQGSMLFKYENEFSYEIKFLYSAINKGEDLMLLIEYNFPANFSSENIKGLAVSYPTIKKLTKDRFVMEGKNADGFNSVFTFDRIK